jgi:hypothetical protein
VTAAERRDFVAFGFASVYDTLFGEKALKAAAVPATTIPAPRELGELCGIALRVLPEDAEAADEALALAGARVRVRAAIKDL